MNKFVLVLCIIVSLILSCSPKVKTRVNDSITSQPTEGQITASKEVEVIKLPIDLKKEEELQREVDKGHQPWRLEPIDVAHVTLIATIDKNIAYENCTLTSETSSESIVKCKGVKTYIVYLKRLVRENGIW